MLLAARVYYPGYMIVCSKSTYLHPGQPVLEFLSDIGGVFSDNVPDRQVRAIPQGCCHIQVIITEIEARVDDGPSVSSPDCIPPHICARNCNVDSGTVTAVSNNPISLSLRGGVRSICKTGVVLI